MLYESENQKIQEAYENILDEAIKNITLDKSDVKGMIKHIMKNTHKDYKGSKGNSVMPPFDLYNKTVLMDLDKAPAKDVQHVFKSLGGKFK